MFIVGILSWWYGEGWVQRVGIVRERLARTLDYFSIGLLLKTLFSPYRQISAGSVDGPLGVKWRAFVDRTISRIIGAIVRMVIIIVGCGFIIIHSLVGALTLVLWFVVPLLPVLIGPLLFISGWVPSL